MRGEPSRGLACLLTKCIFETLRKIVDLLSIARQMIFLRNPTMRQADSAGNKRSMASRKRDR